MDTVRDHLWIWCHEAGSNNDLYGLPGQSRMTPAEAAFYMGLPNLIMVVYEDNPKPPFDRLAISFRPLRQVVWSIIGDTSSVRNDRAPDIDEVTSLAARFPNISGAMMDDFFHAIDAQVGRRGWRSAAHAPGGACGQVAPGRTDRAPDEGSAASVTGLFSDEPARAYIIS